LAKLAQDSPPYNWQDAMALLYAGRHEEAIAMLESLQDTGTSSKGLHIPLNVLAGFDLAAAKPEQALARYRQYKPGCFDQQAGTGLDDSCPEPGFTRVLQETGDKELAQEIAKAGVQSWETFRTHTGSTEYDPSYIVDIRFYALAGQHEKALSGLEELVAKGFRGIAGWQAFDWRYFAYYDISVDSIRDHPRFRAAVATIESDMAQQLENVREMQRNGEVPTLEKVRAKVGSIDE